MLATPLFGSYATRRIVLDHATALRLPAIYQWPDMAEEGGLMAYGPSFQIFIASASDLRGNGL